MNVDAEIEIAKVLGIAASRGKPRSALWISHAIADGLPLSALERLVSQIAPDDKDFIYRFISKPTLARRRKAFFDQSRTSRSVDVMVKVKGSRGDADRVYALEAKSYRHLTDDEKQARWSQRHRKVSTSGSPGAALSPAEGAKVARLAEIWAMARRVWGSNSDARAFLFRPHPLLENMRPIDVVLESEHGRPLVEQVLGRLQYGSAA